MQQLIGNSGELAKKNHSQNFPTRGWVSGFLAKLSTTVADFPPFEHSVPYPGFHVPFPVPQLSTRRLYRLCFTSANIVPFYAVGKEALSADKIRTFSASTSLYRLSNGEQHPNATSEMFEGHGGVPRHPVGFGDDNLPPPTSMPRTFRPLKQVKTLPTDVSRSSR